MSCDSNCLPMRVPTRAERHAIAMALLACIGPDGLPSTFTSRKFDRVSKKRAKEASWFAKNNPHVAGTQGVTK